MDLEEAIAFTDDLLVKKNNQGFSDVEKFIFEGSWKGKTYDEIAADSEYRYTFSYLKQDAGPKLWLRLAKALGKKVNKQSFKAEIERRWRSREQTNTSKLELVWIATIDQNQTSQIESMLNQLSNLVQHSQLKTREVKEGRAIVALESYLEGFDRISQLFQTGQLSEILGIPVEDVRLQSVTVPNNWRQWQQNSQDEIFEPDWQPPELGLAMGGHKSAKLYETEAIARLIQQLNQTNDETRRRQIAAELGGIAVGSSQAIAALNDLLATSQDPETLWQAALSLGKLDPSHPSAGIEMAKAIDFIGETQSVTVALRAAFRPKSENKVSVRLRVEAIDEENLLPPNLQVTVFDESGNVFREAMPTNQDFLPIKGFTGSAGEAFSIRLSLGEISVRENFII